MTLFSGIILLGMAYINYKIFKDYKNFGTVFSFVWSILFIIIFISGDMFYAVKAKSIIIILTGAVLISLGGIIAKAIFYKESRKNKEKPIFNTKLLRSCEYTTMILLPAYVLKCIDVYKSRNALNIFYSMRNVMINSDESPLGSFWSNIAFFSMILAFIQFNEYQKNKKNKFMTILICTVSIVYNILSGSCAMIVFFCLTLMGCYLIRNKEIKIRKVSLYLLIAVFSFLFISFMLNKADIRNSRGIVDNLSALKNNFLAYLIGPYIAFDQTFNLLYNIIPSNALFRNILLMLNKGLGLKIALPPIYFPFIHVAKDIETNVYTIYGYYFYNLNIIEMIMLMVILGILLSYIYKKAKEQSDICIIFYGLFFASVCLSIYGEYFFRNIIMYLKIIVVLFIFYNNLSFNFKRKDFRV